MMKMNLSMKLQQLNEETTSFATARGVQILETNTSRMRFKVQFDMQCTCMVQSILVVLQISQGNGCYE